MVRWQPGAKERLQAAALELFAHRGYEQTTAAEIAESVGLTERTFFRHFTDKREALFHGQQAYVQAFLDGLDSAGPDATPFELIAGAVTGAGRFFPDERRGHARSRQSVIDKNPALQERELHKRAGLTATVAGALRTRGIEEPTASLTAETIGAVFSVAFGEWIADGETRPMAVVLDDVLRRLPELLGHPGRAQG